MVPHGGHNMHQDRMHCLVHLDSYQFSPHCDTVRVVRTTLDRQERLFVSVFDLHTLHGAENTRAGSMQVHTLPALRYSHGADE